MLEKFLAYIIEKALFNKDNQILLAVSGGIDSVVMAKLFRDAGVSHAIAHCNFGLRGEESDADEKFVRKLARKADVPCFVKTFNTAQYAEDHKLSIQMAARELRYNWFAELAKAEGYDFVALAHHQNDLLETILLNLTRGTGIAGLHGIAPKRGIFIRPLLFADKEAIFAFVTKKQLTWREDSSNESNKYQRNKVRQEVVPVLEELNPNLSQTIQQTAEKISAVERFFLQEVERMGKLVLRQQGQDWILDLKPLLESTEPTLLLSQLLDPWGISYSQAREIIAIYQQEGATSGKIFESNTHRLNTDRQQLVISPKNLQQYQDIEIGEAEQEVTYANWRLTFESLSAKGYTIKGDKHLAALDKAKIDFPLQLRSWKNGDWFCPLGMNQKKKLSDFMIDEKIPLNLKERVLVLTSGDAILWVVGYRIDNRFKITDSTTEILEVKAFPHD